MTLFFITHAIATLFSLLPLRCHYLFSPNITPLIFFRFSPLIRHWYAMPPLLPLSFIIDTPELHYFISHAITYHYASLRCCHCKYHFSLITITFSLPCHYLIFSHCRFIITRRRHYYITLAFHYHWCLHRRHFFLRHFFDIISSFITLHFIGLLFRHAFHIIDFININILLLLLYYALLLLLLRLLLDDIFHFSFHYYTIISLITLLLLLLLH